MSMKKRGFVFCAVAVATCAGRLSTALAGFDVSFWHLATSVVETGSGPVNSDGQSTSQIQNPFTDTSLSSVGDNWVRAAYDYGWNVSSGAGVFHNDLEQHVFDPEVRTQAVSVIHILADVPLHVRLTGSLMYAHTPGNNSAFNFNTSVRDLSINDDILGDQNRGGNLYLLPSSGILTMDGEVILQPGIPYRLEYVYDCYNLFASPPVGVMDSSGFVRWEINPVPSPATFMLLLPASLMLLRRPNRA